MKEEKNILNQIKFFEKNIEILLQKLKKQKIVNLKTTYYTKKQKKDFLKFWEEFVNFSIEFQNFIDSIKYKNFFTITNYNNFVIKRYLVFKYIDFLVQIKKIFGKNDKILINFLYKECRLDYINLVKNIYKYEYLKLINPNENFIKNLKYKVDKKYHFMLNAKEILSEKDRNYFFSEKNIFFNLFHLQPESVVIK